MSKRNSRTANGPVDTVYGHTRRCLIAYFSANKSLDLATGRIIVRSPKAEHHEGKGRRTVPIFPELRPYLENAQELAADGTEFIITRYRETKSNLRTHMERIIEKAALKPWPKLFQYKRSARQTEFAE